MRLFAISFLAGWLVLTSLTPGWCQGPQAERTNMPQTKDGIIPIEGHPQEFILRLVDGDPLPFYTYVPHDMEVERFSGSEGSGFRFWLSRGDGDKRYETYATIFVFPPGTTLEQTRQIVDDLMARSGWDMYKRKYPEQIYPWSLYEIPYKTAWYGRPVGCIIVGQHGDSFFSVMFQCRDAFLDGFVPRYLRILEEFVWTDTNEKLPKIEAKLQ